MSIWRIAGGIGIALLGLEKLGVLSVGGVILGIILLVAGIALLFGK